MTCPHPYGRNLSSAQVVFQYVQSRPHFKCVCSDNPCSTECTNACRGIRSGLPGRCRSFRVIHRARNKAGFGLEAGQDLGESSRLVHQPLTQKKTIIRVQSKCVRAEIVADTVQVNTAFWPRQTASHEELFYSPTQLENSSFVCYRY